MQQNPNEEVIEPQEFEYSPLREIITFITSIPETFPELIGPFRKALFGLGATLITIDAIISGPSPTFCGSGLGSTFCLLGAIPQPPAPELPRGPDNKPMPIAPRVRTHF